MPYPPGSRLPEHLQGLALSHLREGERERADEHRCGGHRCVPCPDHGCEWHVKLFQEGASRNDQFPADIAAAAHHTGNTA
jgi:hypothetical protein